MWPTVRMCLHRLVRSRTKGNVFMTEDLVAAAIKATGDLTELMQLSWRDSLQHAPMPATVNQ